MSDGSRIHVPRTYVLRVLNLADGRRTAHDGRFLASYDLNAAEDFLTTTDDPADALHFITAYAALEVWRSVAVTRRTRLDGKPNRPLSAFTMEVQPYVKGIGVL